MSGGTEVHSRLSARMVVLLDRLFPTCRVYDSKLKLYVETWNRGLYTDAMLLCGEPVFWNDQTDVILNPTLVVEVLSSSTHTYYYCVINATDSREGNRGVGEAVSARYGGGVWQWK